MSPREPVTVAVADDHALVRQGLCEILRRHEDLEVVGEAADGAQAVALVHRCRPRVVLLDVGMPGDDVTVTVQRMRAASPRTHVIVLTMHESQELLQRVLAAGVRGFLLKTADHHDLVAAIRSVAREASPVVVEVSPGCLAPQEAAADGALSTRECQILRMVAEACSNRQIARRLEVSEATVKRHIHNASGKLGAVSRIDAVNRAVAARLIPAPRYASSPCPNTGD